MHPADILGVDSFLLVVGFIVFGATLYLIRAITAQGYSYLQIVLLQLGIVVAAIIGAKVFSLYLRGWEVWPWRAELTSGWKYPGALVAMILVTPLWVRVALPGMPIMRLADKLAIVAAFSLAVFRISCFLKGCCTGAVCTEAYCIPYAPGSATWYQHLHSGHIASPSEWSAPVLPLHLFLMLASLSVGLFLLWFEKRKKIDGHLVLVFMFGHEASKAILESFRIPYSMDTQMVSVAIAAIGLLGLLLVKFNGQRKSI